MRYEALIAAVLVLSQVGAGPAGADPRDTTAAPQFTAAETSTVGRNEILRTLMETDPWLVRKVLDTVAERSAKNAAFDSDAFVSNTFCSTPDASLHTDAASVEWLQMLHRVKQLKACKMESSDKSAKGSVEMLELLKKTKEGKSGK
jgi:hypothetical protein